MEAGEGPVLLALVLQEQGALLHTELLEIPERESTNVKAMPFLTAAVSLSALEMKDLFRLRVAERLCDERRLLLRDGRHAGRRRRRRRGGEAAAGGEAVATGAKHLVDMYEHSPILDSRSTLALVLSHTTGYGVSACAFFYSGMSLCC